MSAEGSESAPLDDFRIKLAVIQELQSHGVDVGRVSKLERQISDKIYKECLARNEPKAIFNQHLRIVVENSSVEVDGLRIPRIVQVTCEAVRKDFRLEGLFRVSGNAARMKRMQKAFVEGKDHEAIAAGTAHDHAGILKSFLRDLPDPLCTYRLYEPFVDAYKLAREEDRHAAILLLCLELPKENLHTLSFFMRMLSDLCKVASNKMTPDTMSSIITPNILRPWEDNSTGTTSERELANHASCVGAVASLIKLAYDIGTIPSSLVAAAKEISDRDAKREYDRLTSGKKIPLIKRWMGHKTIRIKHNRLSDPEVSIQTLDLLKVSALDVSTTHSGHRTSQATLLRTAKEQRLAHYRTEFGHEGEEKENEDSASSAAPSPASASASSTADRKSMKKDNLKKSGKKKATIAEGLEDQRM